MTNNVDIEPWRGLSERVAELIEPELEAIAAETLAAIAREVPEYARPLEGSFGRGIRTGVGEALRQFVSLIRDPEGGRGVGREVYVALGRGELRQGRTLDSRRAAGFRPKFFATLWPPDVLADRLRPRPASPGLSLSLAVPDGSQGRR